MAVLPCVWLLPNLREAASDLKALLSPLSCRVISLEEDACAPFAVSDVIVTAAHETEDIFRLRKLTDAWILALQIQGEENTETASLASGADLYMRFSLDGDLLRGRFLALLRGISRLQQEGVFRLGSLKIDFSARCVFCGGQMIELTPTEYRLLSTLASHAGQCLTYAHLCRECGATLPALRVHMTSLRKKLKTDCILTLAGVGYKMPREVRQ